jgi:hypothetical protein
LFTAFNKSLGELPKENLEELIPNPVVLGGTPNVGFAGIPIVLSVGVSIGVIIFILIVLFFLYSNH